MTKICTKCKEEKPLEDFSKKANDKENLRSGCKLCDNALYKTWYEANKKRKGVTNKAWREANKELRATTNKAWYKANKERVTATTKEWSKANRGRKNAAGAKRDAAKLDRTPPWLTKEDYQCIAAIYVEAARRTKETGIPHEVDHIIPLQGQTVSGLHVPSNLQILTKSENCRKSNSF